MTPTCMRSKCAVIRKERDDLKAKLKETREKLAGLYAEVEELVNCDILTDECDLAKNLKNYKP